MVMKNYDDLVKEKPSTLTFRIDDDFFRLLETIRIFHSNEFVTATRIDIIKGLLKNHLAELRKEHNSDIILIEAAVEKKLLESKC